MQIFRLITLFFTVILCSTATAQPRNIDKFISKSTIDENSENKIKSYAIGWANQLQSDDAALLKQAHEKLADPFDVGSGMTLIARSLYGKYLEEGFTPILDENSDNDIAAVNALQIISLLGTEQGCGVLLNHADETTEKRSAVRLWASIGLGTSFLTGELPVKRIERYAKLLPGFINKEKEWYILARQFDSLAALQSVPKIDRSQRNELRELSFDLQRGSIITLLDSISSTSDADSRVQSLSLILPSIRLQLIEPDVTESTKGGVLDAMVPSLIRFVEHATSVCSSDNDNSLCGAYGSAAHAASLLITRSIGSGGGVRIIDLWNDANFNAILERVETWKKAK